MSTSSLFEFGLETTATRIVTYSISPKLLTSYIYYSKNVPTGQLFAQFETPHLTNKPKMDTGYEPLPYQHGKKKCQGKKEAKTIDKHDHTGHQVGINSKANPC